jgi:ubiquinone/menaquinone biosynthesis C-methylase UbiE
MGEVRFLQMDATGLYFADGEFDASFISFGLHDMPFEVRKAVLREMARVTRKSIVVTDYNPPRNHALHALYIALISLDESKYFPEFARRDFQEFLARCGFEAVAKEHAYGGLVRIWSISPHLGTGSALLQ